MRYTIIISVISIFFSGCFGGQKLSAERKAKIEQLQELNKSLTILKEITMVKSKKGEMDGQQAEKVVTALNGKINQNEASINKIQNISNKEYNIIKGKLGIEIVSLQRTIETLRDLYNLETFKAFSSAKFFGVGEYQIQASDKAAVKKDLSPLAEAVLDFLKSHPNQKLKVIIGVYGYSDELAIASGGPLYKQLANLINKPKPTSAELNQKLSELRAKSLASIIEEVMKQKLSSNADVSMINFEINWVGRGIQLPGPIPNPKIDDERRRVVTFIWNVFAEELFQNAI